ncbi:hypothetical protein Vadar_002033 [Vaccinium darrowii]|uniref:Uncharacterized protein n=1 Tax=Vaccinium darrowii TaxID=229202 RepID=A0ACB7XET1_9ERIC|nr:hypothetical protein Vadar_002033 [Vaccinium darrowii]
MEAEEPLASASSSPTPTNSETLVSETEEERGGSNSKPTSFDQEDILRAIEVVERDLVAIAQCFSSLFDSLRLALSEVTSRSLSKCNASVMLQGEFKSVVNNG